MLCRLALANGAIDAGSFTVLRLAAGALVLALLLQLNGKVKPLSAVYGGGSWPSALALFIYAVGFSYAYLSLQTGTGALILFASVQISMLILSLLAGKPLSKLQATGMLTAFCGFVYLVLPNIGTPDVWSALLMMCAGGAWGVYSVRGMSSINPLKDTAANFIRTLPMVLLLLMVTLIFTKAHIASEGIIYALLSGGLTSGIGYALWYKVLPGLNANLAAVSQLSVPMIAALGGVVFVAEPITSRLLWSSAFILGGILLVVLGRQRVVIEDRN